MADINLKTNQDMMLRLKGCGLSNAEINKIINALTPQIENKAESDLSNVENETFKTKAEAAGVGGADNIFVIHATLTSETTATIEESYDEVKEAITAEKQILIAVNGVLVTVIICAYNSPDNFITALYEDKYSIYDATIRSDGTVTFSTIKKVFSVNGRRGEVNLTASDVGACTKDYVDEQVQYVGEKEAIFLTGNIPDNGVIEIDTMKTYVDNELVEATYDNISDKFYHGVPSQFITVSNDYNYGFQIPLQLVITTIYEHSMTFALTCNISETETRFVAITCDSSEGWSGFSFTTERLSADKISIMDTIESFTDNDTLSAKAIYKLYDNLISDKADKPTCITSATETLILTHNQEAHLGEITSLTLSMPETIDNLYWSSFCFTSPETDAATSIIYPAEPIIWVGDDCDADGIFVPEANTRYEVSVKKLGDDIVARVGAY